MVALGMGSMMLEHLVWSFFSLLVGMKGVVGGRLCAGWLWIIPDVESFRLIWGGVCRTDGCEWVFIRVELAKCATGV